MESMKQSEFWWKVLKQLADDRDTRHAKDVLAKIEQLEQEEKKEILECNH